MRILITGGCGGVGQGVVHYLAERGHDVRVVDRQINNPQPGVQYAMCDTTDFAALREQVRGQEGIIHLAAYPYPAAAAGSEIFRVNDTSTFNVFECAAEEGIRRVACASSINALGFNYGVKHFPIQYFPIDEQHPTYTTDPYSFSKQITEAIADYYWRRDGITSACLRMPLIYSEDLDGDGWMRGFLESYQNATRRLLQYGEDQRAETIVRMKAILAQDRASRAYERPFQFEDMPRPESPDDVVMLPFFGYTDFWAALSVADTARAFEQCLLADFVGSHAMYVSEAENALGLESEMLLRLFYPEVTQRQRPISGAESLVSIAKAHEIIGFTPRETLRKKLGF